MAITESPGPDCRLGGDPEYWIKAFSEAFEHGAQAENLLALAETAVRKCPGHPDVLHFAATAALLADAGDKAQVFLKRFAKRYEPNTTHYLLEALTLGRQRKLAAARATLEEHGLTSAYSAGRVFPGGPERIPWLRSSIATILDRRQIRRPASARKHPQEPKSRKNDSPGRDKTIVAAPSGPVVPPLPRLAIDIPIKINPDLKSLAAGFESKRETDGGWFSLRQGFARLSLAQGYDELLCLSHLKGVDPLVHQIETVRKVLKQFRGRVLLADEVGLGKTIEAAMVLKEYLLRGMVKRFLILVPASLVGQWQEELGTKFGISCLTTQDPKFREDPAQFWQERNIVASLAVARRPEHFPRIVAQPLDLVIVDEAHHLKDRSSQSYRLVDQLNKRFLLLLSATPVQNDLVELYNILTLLKPGIFKTLKEFRSRYMAPGKPRVPANSEGLRELMKGAMIRNTRAVVALKLPRRHAATLRAEPSAAERQAYERLGNLARGLAAEGQSRRRLALCHLLSSGGSSPEAAAVAIRRFAARVPGNRGWAALAEEWSGLGPGAKEVELLNLLKRNPSEKKLVFAHHVETARRLARLLAEEGVPHARFDGAMSGLDKDSAIAEFRDSVPVLICTESGGEGRNIQFCNTLINFDVPWNPMAIEQRIGRIDRIGQTREVFIFNLVTRGTIEERILDLLNEKIAMFELIVGEAGAILGDYEEDRDFQDLILDAWLEVTEEDRSRALTRIGEELGEVRRRHEEAKVLDEALFGDDFETV